MGVSTQQNLATRCGRFGCHWAHGHDGAWPSRSRPRRSVALQVTATTERGPPGHGHDRAWPSRSRPRQSVALQVTATTERGPPGHGHDGAWPSRSRPRQSVALQFNRKDSRKTRRFCCMGLSSSTRLPSSLPVRSTRHNNLLRANRFAGGSDRPGGLFRRRAAELRSFRLAAARWYAPEPV